MPASSGEGRAGARTLEKGIDLLEILAGRPDGMSNLDLSRVAGIDKSTSHRLLTTLERRGLVYRDAATKRFRIGQGLVDLAAPTAMTPPVIARPVLAELVDRTSESATLSFVGELSFVTVEVAQAPHEIRFTPEIGRPYPLNAGATGKAILAFRPDLEQIAVQRGLAPITPNSITSPTVLAEHLEGVRHRGYAVSDGERVLGACAIAAPVRAHGRVIGAITVSSVTARCDVARLETHAPAVLGAAAQLSAFLTPRS